MISSDGPSMWATDLTVLCERLAERLRDEGAQYPGPAAVALAVRGARHESRAGFAARVGLSEHELGRVEAGEVPLEAWPLALLLRARAVDALDLRRLVPAWLGQ